MGGSEREAGGAAPGGGDIVDLLADLDVRATDVVDVTDDPVAAPRPADPADAAKPR